MKPVIYAAIAATFVVAFHLSVRTRWPTSYSTASTAIETWVRGSLTRYLVMRTAPTFVGAVSVSVYLERSGQNAAIGADLFVLFVIAATNARAVVRQLLPAHREPVAGRLLLFHAFTAASVAGVAGVAYLARHQLDPLVPSFPNLVQAVWTGLVAAVLAVAAQRVTSSDDYSPVDLQRQVDDIGRSNWDYITDAARLNNCDPGVLRAIVAAESTQRPRWFRRVERAKGLVFRRGSYGVAQMTSQRPLDDRASIDALADSFQGYWPEREPEGGSVLQARFEARLATHNESPVFVARAVEFYDAVNPYPQQASEARALDGRPLIEVIDIEHRAGIWRVCGTAMVHEGTLQYRWTDPDANVHANFTTATIGAPERGEWQIEVPIDATRLVLHDGDAAHIGPDDRAVEIDLMF